MPDEQSDKVPQPVPVNRMNGYLAVAGSLAAFLYLYAVDVFCVVS